jgi:hypothetical protein
MNQTRQMVEKTRKKCSAPAFISEHDSNCGGSFNVLVRKTHSASISFNKRTKHIINYHKHYQCTKKYIDYKAGPYHILNNIIIKPCIVGTL